MKQAVRLNKRASSDGKRFTYVLRYAENGKQKWKTLGHANERKAEKQRAQKEKELQMGYVAPGSVSLRKFTKDSLEKTGDQIRESTRESYQSTMEDLIKTIGNVDVRSVTFDHGEYYRQHCLDRGNSSATVAKKLREIKVMFELGVRRRILDCNPLRYVKAPKQEKHNLNLYSDAECERIYKAALSCVVEWSGRQTPRWDLLIVMALTTGMRRGELLNCTWDDIDFDSQTVEVVPKTDTPQTWKWLIKDTDRRTLPLNDELILMLSNHQSNQEPGYPYVFIPGCRYDWIQDLRTKGRWTYSDSRLKIVQNFTRQFSAILERAHVKPGKFHDLRRTAIRNWFAQGLKEFDVMKLAGHADFKTTHQFYLAVTDDLQQRARQVASKGLCKKLVQIGANAILENGIQNTENVTACKETT